MRSAPGAVERLLIGRGVAILGAIRAGHRMGTGTDSRTGVGTWLDLHGGCLGRDAGVEPGAVDGGVLDRFRGDRGGSGAKRARGRSPPPPSRLSRDLDLAAVARLPQLSAKTAIND